MAETMFFYTEESLQLTSRKSENPPWARTQYSIIAHQRGFFFFIFSRQKQMFVQTHLSCKILDSRHKNTGDLAK